MFTKQQLGNYFEDRVHVFISLTNYQVLREKDIVDKYSRLSYGIDHLIYLPEYIICIQDKWKDSRTGLSDINHFLKCVENIHLRENCKKCIGIYLTKKPITKGASNAFDCENAKGTNYYISIHDDDMDIILDKLKNLFYQNGIFLYEPDGCVIIT